MSALPESRIIAMNFDSHTPCPELHRVLAPARADRMLVALLIELEQDYPLTVPMVGDWLALLVDASNGIICLAVVCQTVRARLMVSGLALAAKRHRVVAPIDCFRSSESAMRWLNPSARTPRTTVVRWRDVGA